MFSVRSWVVKSKDMGKSAQARKKLKRSRPEDTHVGIPEDLCQCGEIDEVDLEITLEVLRKLVAAPNLLNGSPMKPIRAVLHMLAPSIATSNTGGSLIAQISNALRVREWAQALFLLEQMRQFRIDVKLGTLQRWIRDCDSVSGQDYEAYEVIDKILRVINHIPPSARSATDNVTHHPAWSAMNNVAECGPSIIIDRSKLWIIQNTPGPDRSPPNLHPAIIWSSQDGTITLDPIADRPAVTSTPVPHVDGAYMLSSLFSPQECANIISLAESIGLTPDQPTAGSAASLSSILAHNFYWLADNQLIQEIFARIQPCLPADIDGQKLRGLNRRFRLYRYVAGAVYRAHLDGAWPPSGVSEDGKYVYDTSLPEDKIWSKFTLLIYLNQSFSKGETTFFTPSIREGVLDAWPVKPVVGCALIFPHGDTRGSLVHEGSSVGAPGEAKYIIRTDGQQSCDIMFHVLICSIVLYSTQASIGDI